jgi:hypothetical protein
LAHAECDAVAVVFDTTICQHELTVKKITAIGKSISQERRDKIEKNSLIQKIRTISAQHLLQKGSYTPSDREVIGYHEFLAKSRANEGRHTKEIIAAIEHLLKTYEYTETNRKRLEDSLAVFQRSLEQSKSIEEGNRLRDEDMRKRFGEDAVKEMHERFKKNRYRISELWVARWKMNKALFEKYGGRVIFQQAGIEPIDAYRAQLRDIREKGKLKILKPTYADLFSEFERYLDMGHNYLRDDGKKYFDRPYWETADLEENHQKTINEFMAIPHK